MNSNNQQTTRKVLLFASAVDALIAGIILLIYFGSLPVDISGLGIPHWVVGLVGGIWFLSALGVLAYLLTKTDNTE
jgi:hypothetical protein